QGDARRQHVRLRYVHEQDAQGGRWRRELLWP
ncbi:oxidase, partial [Streptomyces sp. NPDC002454]